MTVTSLDLQDAHVKSSLPERGHGTSGLDHRLLDYSA